MEFCRICEIFPGFTPSSVAELTMPQFLLYGRYANEQKMIQPNLRNVESFISMLFGKGPISGKPKAKRTGTFADVVECRNDFNNKVNSIENIKLAKESLMKKTGKTEFNFSDIVREIARMDRDKELKYKLVG